MRGLDLLRVGARPFPGPLVALVRGRVSSNWGFTRAWVVASKPDASLISLGSLKAVPMKEIPTGTPKVIPIGTLMIG